MKLIAIAVTALWTGAVGAHAAGAMPPTSLPEPPHWLQLVVGLAFIATVRRRRGTTLRLA